MKQIESVDEYKIHVPAKLKKSKPPHILQISSFLKAVYHETARNSFWSAILYNSADKKTATTPVVAVSVYGMLAN